MLNALRIYLTLVLSIVIVSIGQDKTAVIKGSVIDSDTREPIASARVTILGTDRSTLTSQDGQFKLESVTPGFYQVKAEADKYEARIENNIELEGRGNDRIIFFRLTPVSRTKEIGEVEEQPSPIPPFVSPKYPEEARTKGIQGTVYVKMLVNEKGIVEQAAVEQSDAEVLNQASIEAAKRWRFKPGRSKGSVVSTWIILPFKFKLSDEDKKDRVDVQPKPSKTIQPKYPDSARKLGLQGEFWIELSIDERGTVTDARCHRLHVYDNASIDATDPDEIKKLSNEMYSSMNDMKEEAVRAAKQWKFIPAKKSKKSVPSNVMLPIKFALDSSVKK